jgi:hypothetical protein
MNMHDKRVSPRAAIIAIADVTEVASGTSLSARATDVSRTGCYVDTLNPMPSKTVVTICLKYKGQELVLPGRIVYVSPGLGMGVRFDDDLSPKQLAVLDRWVTEG